MIIDLSTFVLSMPLLHDGGRAQSGHRYLVITILHPIGMVEYPESN